MNKVKRPGKKRSQMELMGIAIIVILLTIGLLFVVRFVVLKEKKDVTEEYHQTELANSMLTAMLNLNLNTECNDESLSELIQECAKNYNPSVKTCKGGIYDNKNYCQVSHEIITTILSKTFEEWGRDKYLLQICEYDSGSRDCKEINKMYDPVINPNPDPTAKGLTMQFTGDNIKKCDLDSVERSSARRTLTLYPKSASVEIILDICK